MVTTDGAILLGYAAEDPDELEVVGEPFSEERYGIGYTLGDTEFCQYITDTIQGRDGRRHRGPTAFEATLGQSGNETPDPPRWTPASKQHPALVVGRACRPPPVRRHAHMPSAERRMSVCTF